MRSPAWGYFSKSSSPEMAVRPDGRLVCRSERAVGLGGGGHKVPCMGLFFQSRIAPRWPSVRMVGLLVGPKGPLAWAGEAIRSLDRMAYAEGGLGPSIGEHACVVLVTLFVANLRHHSDARDCRQLDPLVAVDLICGQHSVVLLAMMGETVTRGDAQPGKLVSCQAVRPWRHSMRSYASVLNGVAGVFGGVVSSVRDWRVSGVRIVRVCRLLARATNC